MRPLKVYQPAFAADLHAHGEDAADFLQSQFTNELRPFAVGRCTYGLWLDVKGKVQADAWVLQTGKESFRILSEHCSDTVIRSHLERHIVADDVEIEASGVSNCALTLIGESATAWINEQGWPLPETAQFAEGEGTTVFFGKRSSEPSYEIIFKKEEGIHSAKKLLEEIGADTVSESWIEEQRMQIGQPKVPQELGPEDLPGEAAMVGSAVSLQKGCFLGQEVVARMYNVGRPRRGLFLLKGLGDPPVVPGQIKTEQGSLAGTVRSALKIDTHWQGVAMLKLHRVEKGSVLLIDGNPVEIVSGFTRIKN